METGEAVADTSGRMPRLLRRIASSSLLVAAAVAAGCGSADVPRLTAWEVEAPYLPPPDPNARPLTAEAADGVEETAVRTTRGSAASATRPRTTRPAPGAPSDEQVRADLEKAFGSSAGADPDRAAIDSRGLAIIPATAPPRLKALMHAANDVARKPYVYGGGHGRNPKEIWQDTAYDCSGSVSYALAAAGYIDGPMTSGELARWGEPGPGKWVTIYANEDHAFMVVAGLRFDTSGRQRTGTRWQPADGRSYAGFTVRHPPGL